MVHQTAGAGKRHNDTGVLATSKICRAHCSIILVNKITSSYNLVFIHTGTCYSHCFINLAAHNGLRPRAEHVLLGVGIGYGEVLRIGDTDVFGTEVNAAAKLGEDTAQAGEILLTAAVYEAAVKDGFEGFEPLAVAPPGTDAAYRLHYRV